MTIYMYTGTPGSGKSLDACRMLRRHLKKGKPAITNYGVKTDESWEGTCYYASNNSLTPANLVKFAHDYWASGVVEENKILLIVDEAQLKWNSRLWAKDPLRMQWLEFMSQHRKLGYKIVLVCQSDIMIDKQFRTLVEYEVKHFSVENLGFIGKLLSTMSFSKLFYAVEKYYGAKVKTDSYFYRYTKKLGEMYNTYTTFSQIERGTA